MTVLTSFLWLPVGALLALGFLFFQRWSVHKIDPSRRKFSKWLIIGGAIVRWVLIFLFFLIALSHSLFSLLIVFLSFLTSRLIILNWWTREMFINQKSI
jgi:phosphatidylserine synthase